MITTLLVANRGEIARRVFATCRALGIRCVAVHSDVDADMPFVTEADVAVRLPGNTPSETYLRADLILAAAAATGADAIHPGYGFLSENADFARQVAAAGLTWVGPTPTSMELMATKIEAKELMAAAGVPVLTELAPAAITADHLPVLVKASSGGGGRGMRVVRDLAELASTVELASAEAASAFGDPTVFCEPYVENGRHVEVQIVGDTHGRVLVVGERDCSLQRRHQKVIEEAPAPGLSEATRAALHDAARLAGEAINYVGAGTVEFLLSGDRFYFLEMNTRLQVEHPVTECVTGLDLVALQLAVAEGGEVPAQTPPINGHSIEVRLYAEDPARGYQPQSGLLTAFDIPGVAVEFGALTAPGLRLDSGVQAGNEIGTFYDAMIAKVIVWAPTRVEASRRLAGALRRARLHGLVTNRDLLVELLGHPVWLGETMHTTYLDTAELSSLSPAVDRDVTAELTAAVFADIASVRLDAGVQQRIPTSWRNVVSQPQTTRLLLDGAEHHVQWYGTRDGLVSADPGLLTAAVSAGAVSLTRDGVTTRYTVARRVVGDDVFLDVDGPAGHVAIQKPPRFTDPSQQLATGSLLAPMPGSVVAVLAQAGDSVVAGQPILVLEAMKMQHNVTAPHDGVVSQLDVTVGKQVAAGEVLAVVDAPEGSEA